jgi:hypothetical protein
MKWRDVGWEMGERGGEEGEGEDEGEERGLRSWAVVYCRRAESDRRSGRDGMV